MSTRQREAREEEPRVEPAPAAGDAGADEAAARARRLLDVGDDVIRRALSGDSQRFLAQNRQQGGE
jgi:hypothetical protein